MKQIWYARFSVWGHILSKVIVRFLNQMVIHTRVVSLLTKETGGRAKTTGNLIVRNNRVASDTSRLWYIKLLHTGQLNVGILAQITP